MKCDERFYDFGTIKEKDGLVSYKFTFQNVDEKLLAINGVLRMWGCQV